jgi:hypothetical protein
MIKAHLVNFSHVAKTECMKMVRERNVISTEWEGKLSVWTTYGDTFVLGGMIVSCICYSLV